MINNDFTTFFLRTLGSAKARKNPILCDEIKIVGFALYILIATKRYHNDRHVRYMFDKAKELGLKLTQEEKIAIFFHDAVNRMTTLDEIDSTYIMKGMLNTLMDLGSLKKADLSSVDTLICYTMVKPGMKSQKFGLKIANLDWAILGDKPSIYKEYADNIFTEGTKNGYKPRTFDRGRIKFLREVLSHKMIFTHPAFKHLDKQARKNMKAELRRLKQ